MSDIFVSYSSADRARAAMLARALEVRGWSVWWDRTIPPGRQYDEGLEEARPDIACLQELKTSDETFPAAAIEAAGYSAIWHGQKGFNGVAILARGGPIDERRRGLPGDPDDTHSRYLEATVHGLVVASIYLPNGNPQPGPKFDYKLAWFERLIEHAASLVASAQ